MIAIIDYGIGNLSSVRKGLVRAGYQAGITSSPEEVAAADGVILPGVGAYREAVGSLRQSGLDRALLAAVKAGRPVLGICLGLQLFFTVSEEWGETSGLDLIPGRVRRFGGELKIPHMGWNQVELSGESPLFAGIPNRSYFYFVHSYYVDPADPARYTIGRCNYGINFTCAVARDNLYGVQFHPEKSSDRGLRLLANFGKLAEG